MSSAPLPQVTRRPALPLVWIVPLLALAVGGWMVAREFRGRGPEITIEFADGSGVEAGKTRIEYRGVAIGTVTRVDLGTDLKRVVVTARLNRSADGVARAGAQFWVSRPEIGFSGVRGLDTLLTGARIRVVPGTGAKADHFAGLPRPPPQEDVGAGRAFILRSDRLNSLTPGAPVYYREVKVGAVETGRLAEDATAVLIRVRIQAPFDTLVRENSRFWVAGGPSFRMGLLGAEFKSTSLEALFSGGAAFATPEGPLAAEAADGAEFPLHREPEKDWEAWRPKIPILAPESSPEQESNVPPGLVPTGG